MKHFLLNLDWTVIGLLIVLGFSAALCYWLMIRRADKRAAQLRKMQREDQSIIQELKSMKDIDVRNP